jgi:hypothetical protein
MGKTYKDARKRFGKDLKPNKPFKGLKRKARNLPLPPVDKEDVP